jgi:hypothetical protein
MVKVDVYNKRTWIPERASYKLGSAIAALIAGSIALFFQVIQGVVGQPPNYGLAIGSMFLVLLGLFSAYSRERVDNYYRISPRPPLAHRPLLAAFGSIIGFFVIGITQKIVIAKELSSVILASTNTAGQIAILGGSGISENLFVHYLLLIIMFNALLNAVGNYWISIFIAEGVANTIAWVFHYGVYGLDPSYFIFVFTSFVNMGILYWLFGSVISVIAIHVWWNIGGLIATIVAIPTFTFPLLGTLDPITVVILASSAGIAYIEAGRRSTT